MKPRHMIIINVIFVSLILFSSGVVYQFMTGDNLLSFFKDISHGKAVVVNSGQCSTKEQLDLSSARSSSLAKLATYQHACRSFVTDTSMVFISMPTDNEQAVSYAKHDALILKEYVAYKVRPLVIAEPSLQSGELIDFSLFADGTYNNPLQVYFETLKKQGITDTQMGIWNPFPEANLPYWKNNKPEHFAPAVNNYVTALRKEFPTAATSIMLNSATYESTDFNWENGDYSSLLPYVQNITPGSITYAGIQGFPWMARAGGTGAVLNGAEFINPTLLIEMAEKVGTKRVWFNTGTFTSKYALDPSLKVVMTPERRKAVLTTINDQAIVMKQKGYEVAVNIFAKDKTKSPEETDWSYWKGNDPLTSPSTPVITDFITQMHDEKIGLWLFDN